MGIGDWGLGVGEERTAARLTDIFHDAADAHRPVKFLAQEIGRAHV